nr:HNH endonuclease [Enterobacter sp. RHBSTW-00994]
MHQRLSLLSDSAIEQRVLSLISSDGDEQAQRDCLAIQQDKSIEDTVREQLIAARLGQGTFRKNCLMLYPACPVTGTTFAPLLRASHIKPWAACKNGNERLDPFNGIILAAHIDILFDQGWISFENDGRLLISNELDISVKEQLLLPEKIKTFSVESYCYLEWHRENLLR